MQIGRMGDVVTLQVLTKVASEGCQPLVWARKYALLDFTQTETWTIQGNDPFDELR